MASRDKEQAPRNHHHPLLSSLVVRPEVTTVADTGDDFESGEFRRDHRSPYSRSDRYSGDAALMMKACCCEFSSGCILVKRVNKCVGLWK
ncbi:hypothetical protein Lalb_Chr24g0397411 [Lupinus albus]|uniref:Uncharacterized protein n=1 Tax=Lupinus albus TaxID=3870 RepID=A0A6A4MZC8_LUPAL|nr:hypothetical protein Lalb_Chr24g0397411 [Lupinus albus]